METGGMEGRGGAAAAGPEGRRRASETGVGLEKPERAVEEVAEEEEEEVEEDRRWREERRGDGGR